MGPSTTTLLLALALVAAPAPPAADAADAATAIDVQEKPLHSRDRRSFPLSAYISKSVKSQGYGGGASNGKVTQGYLGGCPDRPVNPPFTLMQCAKFSGCRVTCMRGYEFPNGETRLFLTCQDSEWHIEGAPEEPIPGCHPVCLPPCQNKGICVEPNTCNCTENYSGPRCQFSSKPCLNEMPLPGNSMRRCNSKTCNIQCLKGHQFPDGSSIASVICQDGMWVPAREGLTSIPDCEPICSPPCLNGGVCLSFNMCQCPDNFKGLQCEFSKEVCNPEKLNFNGNFKCKGDRNSITCHLSCPSGEFESKPADAYICEYAVGKYFPQPIPKCIYDMEVRNEHFLVTLGNSSFFSVNEGNHISLGNNPVLIKTPVPGTCNSWADHYKTFDGRILSFKSNCSYTLVHEVEDNTFSIALGPKVGGIRDVLVYADKVYVLTRNAEGVPVLRIGSRHFRIPTQLPGVRVKYNAHFVEMSFTTAGFSVLWDAQSVVSINVKESLWNRTAGLCGVMDGFSENDLRMKDGSLATRIVPFVNSWQVEGLGEVCSSVPDESQPCDSSGASPSFGSSKDAFAFCDKLLSDPRFSPCRTVVDVRPYYEACLWDYCSCQSSENCACQSISMYMWQCSALGVTVANWRDAAACPMDCGGGRIYMACSPKTQPTCGSREVEIESMSPLLAKKGSGRICIEGCYCPEGTVLHEQRCITPEQCPCQLRGQVFKPGHTIPKDCNTCICEKGNWRCTQTKCSARCSCIGDPHYTTFDGRSFDFMGKCSYHLVKGDNYSIEAKNVACDGAHSKNGGTAKSPSCARRVTVQLNGKVIQLRQGNTVFVDDIEISRLPVRVAGAYIHEVSSLYILVEMPNNLTVWWDGATNLYVDAPPSLYGKTMGLCGTFNYNQKDDFLTPEEDVEQSVIAFANKWKTEEVCEDEPEEEPIKPCDINPHKRESAEKYCNHLKGTLFERCHWLVDPEPFYRNCLYDMCSCEQKPGNCLCPILAAYAKECTRKGIQVLWRSTVRECGITCPRGQQYQVCGDSCTRSCLSISQSTYCSPQCVEGCNCPKGQTINDETGDCIPIAKCPCQLEGLDFPSGIKDIRLSKNEKMLCTCKNAKWDCRQATRQEIEEIPSISESNKKCSDRKNETFSTCKLPEPVTCKNMHNPPAKSPGVCQGGCTCKKGYVLDHGSERCIRPRECPCHHGGQSYAEGSAIQEECNTCTCKAGKWKCTENVCAGVCSAWGDSHFKTFDSHIFDFHGTCDYVLAKGYMSNDESFDITIQNVQCSSLGASCSKSVTLNVARQGHHETITFVKDKTLSLVTGLQRIQVRTAGLFVFAEVADLGLVLQWDQGTRVYVKLAPTWKNKVRGLCGNFNDNILDDFQTPSGGPAEVSSSLFGDSWRLQEYCPESVDIRDACTQHPHRKLWAMHKCGVLKSSLFQACHSEVPVEPYLERCIFDSCACDLGGDCECLCTALAAYSYECNMHGVPIRWRSQKLCPMQCDEKCSSYSPCIATCPKKTCENQYVIDKLNDLCKEDTCVEGCEVKPCSPGQVHFNQTSFECVPVATCKTVCLEVEGVTYIEGDVMEQDKCHTCYCSRHEKKCIGTPCSTPVPTLPTEMPPQKQPDCASGWSQWINSNVVKGKVSVEELEPVPNLNSLQDTPAHCFQTEMTKIECQTAESHLSYKEWAMIHNVNVACDLENGFVCKGSRCEDFEVRVFCDCDTTSRVETTSASTTSYVPPQITSTIASTPKKTVSPETEETTTVSAFRSTPKACDSGDVWISCGVFCDQVCQYYGYELRSRGFCRHSGNCFSGCVSDELSGGCPKGYFWRDHRSCVARVDCPCTSHNGMLVKPGAVINESDCETCQCINNQYICDTTRCETTPAPPDEGRHVVESTTMTSTLSTKTSTTPLILPPSSVTPPLPCQEDKFIALVGGDVPLSDSAFSASSSTLGHQPHDARGGKDKSSSWIPEKENADQYLQVDLGEVEPVYGISVQGSEEGYVTSYDVLYSTDGHFFHYIMNDDGFPAVFRGPMDNRMVERVTFTQPVEARFVRFHPKTWNDAISVQLEIFGCSQVLLSSPPPTTITTVLPEDCVDEMGLDRGLMSDTQVTMSSVRGGDFNKYGPSEVHLSAVPEQARGSGGAWLPATNDQDQWLQFDFLEPRKLSGFITKGLEDSDSWVEVFKVQYSHDGNIWNHMLEDDGKETRFRGNIDDKTRHSSKFKRILRTQFLRLIPDQWHKNIAVRAEIIGCFEPYPEISTTTTPRPECRICPGLPIDETGERSCRECPAPLHWDGTSCINQTHCPCFVEHLRYEIGQVYATENCHECVCKIGGFPDCKRKECINNCKPGYYSALTAGCGCVCKPCADGTVLCPSSNVCIEESLWCNGVEDCPDDERNCTAPPSTPISLLTTVSILTSEETVTGVPSPTTTACPKVECPPGQKPRRISFLTSKKRFGNVKIQGNDDHLMSSDEFSEECDQYECVPIETPPPPPGPVECPKLICPPTQVLVKKPGKEPCLYACVPRHAVCNVTQKALDTFDGTGLKHALCNHILSRDAEGHRWGVSWLTTCSGEGCSRHLSIEHDLDTINLYSDGSVNMNGVYYSPPETKYLRAQSGAYAVNRVGDSLLLQSFHFGFWVIWDSENSAKVGVTGKLFGRVEGLCGTFNGDMSDDRTTPSGKIAKTSHDFVKSWAIPGLPECEVSTCPRELLIQAQEICNSVWDEPLKQCSSVVDFKRFIDRCIDSTCSCLRRKQGKKVKGGGRNCRCHSLLSLVTECQAADSSIDLSGWRTHHGCPAFCPPPLVHHDCYRHKCEPKCGQQHESESCEALPGTCFSGCFCPDGFLRQGDRCLSLDECRDCVCNGLGDSQYLTFDRSNFTFNGNCTYVASQDKTLSGKHQYQVLVTNKKCPDEPLSTCTEAVNILYNGLSLAARQPFGTESLEVLVDGVKINEFPHKRGSLLRIELIEMSEVSLLVLPIQLEVTFSLRKHGFAVRLPSRIFKGKTEGLCGNCNRNKKDDFTTKNGTVVTDTDEFALSWLHPQFSESGCSVVLPPTCFPPAPEEDPCLRLIDSPAFQKCRNILDPAPYVAACQSDLCHSMNSTDAACRDMEAYVTACLEAGVCLDWRNEGFCAFECPEGKQYQACQPACSKTCETIQAEGEGRTCSSVALDGCYCPAGEVLESGKCISESQCYPCDTEGHYNGDEWQQDVCTNCSCVGATKVCVQMQCSLATIVCDEGMQRLEVPAALDECCNKVICVPGPTPTAPTTCPEPQVPKCKEDQFPTSVTAADGCTTIVCQCKPCTDEDLEAQIAEEDLLPGFAMEIDHSGCCKKAVKNCYPERCPKPMVCDIPFLLEEVPADGKNLCCSHSKCVPPPNSCIIEDEAEGKFTAKKIGSKWKETPCRVCECHEVAGRPELQCSETVCPAADMDVDISLDYIVESKHKPGECCPSIAISACRVNNTELQIGDSKVDRQLDHCTTYSCERSSSGDIVKRTEIERCKVNCNEGWEYASPTNLLDECCGQCRPLGCLHEGLLHGKDTSWKSEDNCIDYFCVAANETFQIDIVKVNCPTLPKEIHEDYLIEEQIIAGECCPVPKYLACKFNGKVVKEGELVPDIEDPCKRFVCELKSDGSLLMKETLETCSTNCSRGWIYEPATPGSGVCCGYCKQEACIFGDKLYSGNSTWTSPDECSTYECQLSDSGQYETIVHEELCPLLTDCPLENIYQDKCCKKCNVTTGYNQVMGCEAKEIPQQETHTLIVEKKSSHGQCINEPLKHFTECEGNCLSRTLYNQDEGTHVKDCKCCQPEKFSDIKVVMICEDNHKYSKTVSVPSECSCQPCESTKSFSDHDTVY